MALAAVDRPYTGVAVIRGCDHLDRCIGLRAVAPAPPSTGFGKHPYVRWHGRQGLLLAGLRTAFSLGYVLLFYSEGSLMTAIWILSTIWLAGNIWGTIKSYAGLLVDACIRARRGAAAQMAEKSSAGASRRFRQATAIRREWEVLLAEGQRQAAVSELLAAFRSGDSGIRGKASSN